MPELVRPIRPWLDLKAYRRLRRRVPTLEARGRAHAQLEGGHPGPGGRVARARAGGRPHDPRDAVRSVRDTAQEPPVHRAREVGRPPVLMRSSSVCDAMTTQALAAGVGRPEQYLTVYSGMDADAFLNPPRRRARRSAASWGWPTTTWPSPPSRGSSSSRATTTSSRSPARCSRRTRRSGSSGSATASCGTADAEIERLGIRSLVHPHRARAARPHSRAAAARSTP